MARVLAPTPLRCRPGWNADRSRCGLVLDYRGDDPPQVVLDALRAAGWATPAALAPPKEAVDWTRPDPSTGRRYRLRPFLVVGAVVVPGPDQDDHEATVDALRRILGRCGVTLEDDGVRVDSLTRTNPGYAEVIEEGAVPGESPPPGVAPTAAPAVATVPDGPGVAATTGSVPGPPPSGPLRFEPPGRTAVATVRPTSATVRGAADTVVVTASLRPASLGAVVAVLDAHGVIDDAWATTATGWGASGGRVVRFRGQKTIEMDQRVHLQVAVAAHRAELIVAAVAEAARAGAAGDGTAWVV